MDTTGFFKVRINSLIPGKSINFDLYLKLGQKLNMYLRAGDKLDGSKIGLLDSRDRTGEIFFVREDERKAFKQYVQEQMVASDISVQQKATLLRESSIIVMEELFESPDVHQALENSKPIIHEFVEFMKAEPESMASLISLSSHDFYTYNHSLDVSIYSLGLGEAVGMNQKELEELGIAALFHDIGKRQISLDILCKKGPLNDAEWSQMQKHPQYGLVILDGEPSITEGIRAACFEHHESWAGNGYPQQLSGDEIHPFARIVAITDTYDAMTTQRSYNVPLKPVDAVEMMKVKLAGRYDPKFLHAMYHVLFRLKAA